ncbi:omptin family outer membrane protease [Desulfoprunum benzoelyticum]|uniref:Outer membrane protease n=1 Tax=Desulfoprunum benzoelyticum TaxID=1506996 RepID=A0A840UNX1_9BACT|nr:omptin family outer membrane protease [Desulfoprunum benzoelyticum]MBB5347462.1 outer membrane protease [Desulfoprunum benzoelyticum]MBM9529659.1 omptin family outer membrane protease [Desulfoprunum benzoelyticum]
MQMLTNNRIIAFGLGVIMAAGAGTATASDGAVLGAGAGPVSSPAQAPVTSANTANYSLSIGPELMSGDTTYRIGYPVVDPAGVVYQGYFPLSELVWPLDFWLARIDGRIAFNDEWRINATIKKDVSTPGDDMEDSDWMTPAHPSRLDIYSESEISSFDAFIFDADIEWSFLRRNGLAVYAGVGYLYQDFDYEAKPLYQNSPSGLPGFDYYGDGRVGITYDMTYSIPYLKLGADLQVGPNLSLEGSVAYSPIVEAEDTDHHLLREYGGKISAGDMDGDAFMLDISGTYTFTPALYMELGLQYVKIEVDGNQTQEYGWGIPIGTLDEESESSQTSVFVSVGYLF